MGSTAHDDALPGMTFVLERGGGGRGASDGSSAEMQLGTSPSTPSAIGPNGLSFDHTFTGGNTEGFPLCTISSSNVSVDSEPFRSGREMQGSSANSGAQRRASIGKRNRPSNEELERIAAGNGPEARQAARQLKNRYSAAKSRLRKEAEIKQLRVELDQLRKDVEEKDQLLYRKDAVIQYLSEKLEMYESLESFSHPAHSKARKT
eukprot:gb/GECG01012562.1/.p1 GENE.gb/GECG01012562.1/~~gb/GECG01012562.1/.p1  ORF type:complete len:205 (+),score=27.44 gb/GECG01012562.1/:1-615(+)